jgi:hypothetical protein
MARELDEFLAQGRPEPEPAPPPPESTPPPEQPQQPAVPAKEAPAKAPEPEAEEAEPELQHDGAVPRPTFDKVRHERRDWKEKAVRYETEATELRKQLEEAKRVVAAPPQPQPQPVPLQVPPLPDFHTDPQGYIEALSARHAFDLLNQKLNSSEQWLRDKIGDDKVDSYLADFNEMAQADPSLKQKAFAARNPFGFLQKEVDRHRHYREVGDDPEAFKAKLRKEWEAELASRQAAAPPPPAQSPVAGMQPSLANARSSAPRSAPPWSGEITDDELVRSIQTRKQRNGH